MHEAAVRQHRRPGETDEADRGRQPVGHALEIGRRPRQDLARQRVAAGVERIGGISRRELQQRGAARLALQARRPAQHLLARRHLRRIARRQSEHDVLALCDTRRGEPRARVVLPLPRRLEHRQRRRVGRGHPQRRDEPEDPLDLVPGRGRRQRIGQPPAVALRLLRIRDRARGVCGKRTTDRARRLLATGRDRNVETLAAQGEELPDLAERRAEAHRACVARAAIHPDPLDIGIAGDDPRVVIVGEHVDAGAGQRAAQVREKRGRQQQVADLVALDDQDFHSSRNCRECSRA